MCGVVIVDEEFELAVPSTQVVPTMLGKRFLFVGAKDIDFRLTIYRITSNVQAVAAIADMIARGDLVASLNNATGTVASSAAIWHFTYDCTTTTTKFLGQAAVAAQLASGTTAGYVKGRLRGVLRACQNGAGNRMIEIDPNQTNGAPHVYPLGRVPASGADKVRAAIIANAVKDIEVIVYVRGIVDPEAPGSWVAIGTYTALADGASAICIADASMSGVTPASYHELEIGLAVRLKSGGSAPAGFLKALAGVSYT